MTLAVMKTKAEQAIGEEFERAAGKLPGPRWVRDLRTQAIGAFGAMGLPHRRIEAFKYTDLRDRLREFYPPALPGSPKPVDARQIEAALGPLAGVAATRIVFVDGAFRPELSASDALEGLVEVRTIAEALKKPAAWVKGELNSTNLASVDATQALNLAFMSDGAVLKLARDARVDQPIVLVFARSSAEPRTVTTRNIVKVEAGARAALVEVHIGLPGASAKAHTNTVTDIDVGDRANVVHIQCLVGGSGSEASHLSTWQPRVGAEASYRAFQLTAAVRLARNQLFVTMAGEGSDLDLSGLFLASGGEHVDTTLVVDHAVPGCRSRELFRGVLADRARGVFQGKIVVRPDAQKTDGKQMAQALMLSPDAEFDSKPELEIFADDVVCGHGSTVAQIDPDLIFYCRSRGIPEPEARALLIRSFIGETLDKLEDENLRAALMKLAEAWLAERSALAPKQT